MAVVSVPGPSAGPGLSVAAAVRVRDCSSEKFSAVWAGLGTGALRKRRAVCVVVSRA